MVIVDQRHENELDVERQVDQVERRHVGYPEEDEESGVQERTPHLQLLLLPICRIIAAFALFFIPLDIVAHFDLVPSILRCFLVLHRLLFGLGGRRFLGQLFMWLLSV